VARHRAEGIRHDRHHLRLDAGSIQTTEMAVRDTLKVLMAAPALTGISGMYLSQVRRNGLLGLVGYLVLSAGYLKHPATDRRAAAVLPGRRLVEGRWAPTPWRVCGVDR
jgi:hypothetical protein